MPLEYKVAGLDCADEVALLKKALAPVCAEDQLRFDLLRGKLIVDVDSDRDAEIVAAVKGTGLSAVPWSDAQAPAAKLPWYRGNGGIIAACGGCALLAFAYHMGTGGIVAALTAGEDGWAAYPLPSILLYLSGTLLGLLLFTRKAWGAVRNLRPDMNLLMFIAVAGALGLGNLFEAALVCFLFALSLLLETWSVGRARRAIEALMDLTPPTARFRSACGTCVHEKPVADVPLGATVLLRPGERFPLDGRITKGETSANQAPITGESMPVPKAPGDEVFAGSINGEGAIEFETTKAAGDTVLARCVALVEEARSSRAPVERWIDQFARYYTPAMLLLALAVFFALPFLSTMTWGGAFYQALVLLLIACPCALVISTPVTVVAGLASAARAGVLIKGGAFIEAPARLRAIALDKTGTLTTGAPRVDRIAPLNGHSESELLSMAASIESLSAHPLAKAIVRRAEEDNVAFTPATSYTEIKGKGAEAHIGGNRYWIGSHKLLAEKGLAQDAASQAARDLEDAGHSVVLLGSEVTQNGGAGHVCGVISIADGLRPETKDAITALRTAGIAHITVLTGDNAGTARAIADAAGIDDYSAELLPEDKAKAVQALVAKYGNVAMVGDGVNDAPAMAAASLGIAMGAAGSDAAIETADIALMSDDLSKLAWLVNHSRRVIRVIKQNIALALGLKAVVFVLALFGIATLWLAILADMGASLLVIFNGLRLLRAGD